MDQRQNMYIYIYFQNSKPVFLTMGDVWAHVHVDVYVYIM